MVIVERGRGHGDSGGEKSEESPVEAGAAAAILAHWQMPNGRQRLRSPVGRIRRGSKLLLKGLDGK